MPPPPLLVSWTRLQRLGRVVYKLGDFGQVSRLGVRSVEEGDSRYLSPDLLENLYNFPDLVASDVYALGMTLFELASGAALPSGGDAFRALRTEGLPAKSGVGARLGREAHVWAGSCKPMPPGPLRRADAPPRPRCQVCRSRRPALLSRRRALTPVGRGLHRQETFLL